MMTISKAWRGGWMATLTGALLACSGGSQDSARRAPATTPAPVASGSATTGSAAAGSAAVAPTPTPPPAPDAAPAPPPDPLAPLPADHAAALAAIPADPAPEALIRDTHYWVGNEKSLAVWHADVAGRGGGYLGVGTDQNYLLAGWQQASLIVVVDFDQGVIDLHRAYLAFFDEAETPADFLALWDKANRARATALIEAHVTDAALRARVLKAFGRAAADVDGRLRYLMRTADKIAPTFLTDAAQYAHVRKLVQHGRVYAVRGDYTADATLLGLADALTGAGLDLSVIYLSNIEQYFDYGPTYRRNMLALPVAKDAIVIRTLGWKTMGWVEKDTYHYNTQPAASFNEWLRTSTVANLPAMLKRRTSTDKVGVSRMDEAPKPGSKPPKIADRPTR
jgi:hypothetical protein